MNALLRVPVGLFMGFALVVLTAVPSMANVTLTGQIVQINAPPSDVQGSDPTSNTDAYIWSERTALVLPSAVSVELTAPGTANSGNGYSPSPGTIAAGTLVDTYLIHSDPTGSAQHNYVGTVTFDAPILGIIDLTRHLANTDSILGNPGTTYPGASTDRGLENPDNVKWVSSNELSINFTTSTYVDEIRVLTAFVPEPSTAILAVVGVTAMVGFGWDRRCRVHSSPDAV